MGDVMVEQRRDQGLNPKVNLPHNKIVVVAAGTPRHDVHLHEIS